jgi:hypothetical protein
MKLFGENIGTKQLAHLRRAGQRFQDLLPGAPSSGKPKPFSQY